MDLPLPAAESLTPKEFQSLLEHLRAVIRDLPIDLPIGDPLESKYSTFLSFELEDDLVEKTGSDSGALNEQFKRVFGWKTRTTGDQLLSIEERGEPILAVVDVLEKYHLRYPNDNLIKKWAVDVAAGVYKVYRQYNQTPVAWTATKKTQWPAAEQSTLEVASSESDSPRAAQASQPALKSARTHASGSKGRPLKPLMNKLIIRLDEENGWRCIASGCDHVRKGSPQENRVLKHASTCRFLDLGLKREAIEASKSTSLGAQSRAASASAESTSLSLEPSSSQAEIPSDEPPAKKLKATQSKLDLTPFRQAAKRKKQEQDQDLQRNVNLLILKLICVRGLVPSVLDSLEWKSFITTLNPSYIPTSSSSFTHDFIPKEAVSIRDEQIKKLQGLSNLTLTFDGTTTRKPHSIYTVHATTPDRKTYFLEGYEESDARHTSQWIQHKILKTIREVGEDKWAGICSDSTAVTKSARHDIVMSIPTMLDLNDACHHIHNTIKDITSAEEFQHMLSMLKPIIKHFSKSTKSVALLRKERRIGDKDEKVNMLQKIGKTRFGTHWLAATSLEQCFPNIRHLVETKHVKFRNKKIQDMFLNRHQSTMMEHDMVMYISIVAPFIRSLWALEAAHANASDVFVFWLAIGATLKDLFAQGQDKTGIPSSLIEHVTNVYNTRWKQFFTNDIYFTAFALDPRYLLSDYFAKPILAPATIRIPPRNPPNNQASSSNSNSAIQYPRAYDRVKEFLKNQLKIMLAYSQAHPDHEDELSDIVCKIGPANVVDEFRNQLKSYWQNEWPFNVPVADNDPYTWWKTLQAHPYARVLSILATKVFAVLVNSMPDERTGSTLTWLNSPLRANQNAQTLIDMIQIGQYYRTIDPRKPRKEPYRPVVKFRDMDRELLQAVSLGKDSESTVTSATADVGMPGLGDAAIASETEDEDDSEVLEDEESRFRAARRHTQSGNESAADLLADEEVSLDNVLLRDLLAMEPVAGVASQFKPSVVPKTTNEVSTTQPDWDF